MTAPPIYVVVGGGVVGCCTAYFLSRNPLLPSDAKIVVIETAHIAAGASGNAGGFMALDWHSQATSSLAELSYNLHASLAKEHDGEKKWGYRKLSTLSLSYSTLPKTLAKVRGKISKNPPPEVVSSWVGPGITDFGSIGTKETTAQVTPALFTREILEIAKRTGKIKVLEGYEVDEVEMKEKKALNVKASYVGPASGKDQNKGAEQDKREFNVSTGGLVVAAGPWTGQFAEDVLKMNVRVNGHRAHSILIEPNSDTVSKSEYALFTELEDKNGHWGPEVYPRADGTVYICGPNPAPDISLPRRVTDVAIDSVATQSLLSQVASLSPDHFDVSSSKATLKRAVACYLPTTPSKPGMIGKLGENIVVGSALNVWGITLGLASVLLRITVALMGRGRTRDWIVSRRTAVGRKSEIGGRSFTRTVKCMRS